jgi:nitrate reductase assembly molybdenum cofactor insertion protein NarJ
MSAFAVDVMPELGAAAQWRLLALLLSRPRAGWREEVAALARERCDDERLRGAARAAKDAREGDYHALLGAGGVASPRAAAHAGFLDPGRILADLAARYAAFGFAPRAEEADDHLSVECDFVAYLFLKEAYARARGDDPAAAVTREERARFLSEHLALVGRGFAAKLPEGAPPHLVAAAACLVERLPPAPAPPTGSAGPEEDPLCEGCPGAEAPCAPSSRPLSPSPCTSR